jgi:signal transduction histidine kinase
MKRREAVPALVVAAMVGLALLAVFAIELADVQAKSRRDVEARVHERTVLAAALIDSLVGTSAQTSAAQGARLYGGASVSDRLLDRNAAGSTYLALVSPSGTVLAASRGFTAQARVDLGDSAALRLLRAGHPWALGNVLPFGRQGVINFGVSLHTAEGTRYLLDGLSPGALGPFLAADLRQIPGVTGAHNYALDTNGVVLASTNPARPTGYTFHTPNQLNALNHSSGDVGGRYFDQIPLANTSWRILLTAPDGPLFATVSGLRHSLPWLIFAAFALVCILAMVLALRALRDRQRVRESNAQLTTANSELARAKLSLEELNDALEVSNAELHRRARELVRSNAELDQFASIASHDLQEPLRKVRTFTARISETESGRLSERGVDYLQRANASAERMQKLIEDLLTYSRVATQGRPFAPVDLGAVTAEVLEDLADVIQRSGAAITVGRLPTISADPPQMRQLIQNLLSNALKFRREGVVPEIEVSADVGGGVVTLVVRDNGIGFDPQYSERIFRVFERLHGRSTYAGTGIGLALCRKIAERHGGTVTAEGAPGRGSTFSVAIQSQRTEPVSDTAPVAETMPADPDRGDAYVTV